MTLLDVRVRTPHGVPVPAAGVLLAGGGEERAAVEVDAGLYHLRLPCPGDYQLRVQRYDVPGGFDHRTFRQSLFFLVEGGQLILRALTPPGAVRSSVEVSTIEGGFLVDVCLDYLWFTPVGTPPTLGNAVRLLVDGEEGWAAVAAAIHQARRAVHLTTWLYQPTLELLRPDPMLPAEVREKNTIHDILEAAAARGATVRLLLWDAPVLLAPGEARRVGRAGSDNFEVLQQENPTQRPLLNDEEVPLLNKALGEWKIGSYHQKTVVVDGEIGFCGGMNLKENDWDSRAHQLFDPRRARFDRERSFRERIRDTLVQPDHRPRHDFIAEVRGPAVQHVGANFQQRWNYLLDEGVGWAENATAVPDAAPRPPAGPSQVQVVRTMPEPFAERGILDAHLRAITAARKLIFIEDQYFRSTHVSDAIALAVRKWPDLHVIVVTVQSYAEDIYSGGWTQECFERIRDRKPDLTLYALKVRGVQRGGAAVVEEIDNHAKLMIVDDVFLTVGSCNINDRGFEYEGEINLALVDRAAVPRMRLDLWRSLLAEDPRLTGDIDADVAVWQAHAARNAAFERGEAAEPASLVYPFVPRTQRRRIAGRDVM